MTDGRCTVACNPTQHIFLLGQLVQACTAGQAERASRETPAVFGQAAGAFFSLREHIELGRMHATERTSDLLNRKGQNLNHLH